jgi:hypothetical protein
MDKVLRWIKEFYHDIKYADRCAGHECTKDRNVLCQFYRCAVHCDQECPRFCKEAWNPITLKRLGYDLGPRAYNSPR